MAIPYPASYQQGSYAVLVHQGLFGFAANSEASLLTAMNTLKLKNGIIKENTKTKLIQNELKAAFNVDNPKKIDKQALINLMEAKLGITLSAAEEAALLSQKQVTIVSQILARADVVNKFLGPIDAFLQDAAVDPTNFQTDLNNAAPTDILPNDASIAENAPGGSLITTLTAVDPDAGDTFTFKLVSDASGKFDVLSDGQVRLKPGAELDFETATSHQITVEVKDQWGGTYQEVITINVTDVDPEPGNIINLTTNLDFVDGSHTPPTTVNNDVIRGNVLLSQVAVGAPTTQSGTANGGDFIDGLDGHDILQLSLGGSIFGAPTDIVIQGIASENVEELVVVNSVQTFTDNIIIDMTQHKDVEIVQLPFSNTDLMLRDMQGGMVGGDIFVKDPHGGRNFHFDFDASFLGGDEDSLTVHVDEMKGGGILITENSESAGLVFGSGDPADLEQLYVSFEGERSELDYITAPGTSEFYFSGPADFLLGNGIDSIDTFVPGDGGDSFFDDMGNDAATLIDGSALGGDFYINLSNAPGGGHNFEFIGSQGDDLTIIGDSLREDGDEGTTFDGQGGHNTAILFGAGSIPTDDNGNLLADNPLVNYQTVAFTEPLIGSVDARYFGQQVEEIVLMDGLDGALTVFNTDVLPEGTVFRFADEDQMGFPIDNNPRNAHPRNFSMSFLTPIDVPPVEVTVHFDDQDLGFVPNAEDITFFGPNVGVMNLGGTGAQPDIDVTFDGDMDTLATLNIGGNNHFQLKSAGAGGILATLATIDGTNNSGGIDMQDGPLNPVTSSASHLVVSDIVSGVLGQTIKGGSAADILVGSAGGDLMEGNGGADYMAGNAGNDTMNGGAGNDAMQGGDGDDVMDGGADNDTVVGGDGGDTIGGNTGNDALYGWAGNDTLDGGAGNDLVKGGAGEDVVGGGTGVNELWGDYSGQPDEPDLGTAAPQTSTITISNVDVGDTWTVVVSGYGGQPDKIVSVPGVLGSDPASIAAAIVTALTTGPNPLPAANVTSDALGVVTIVGNDLTDVFTVTGVETPQPSIYTLDFNQGDANDGADIGDVVTVSIDGAAPQPIVITETLTDGNALAQFIYDRITLPANVTASLAGDTITFTKPFGPMAAPSAAFTDNANTGIFSFQVGDISPFNDGEQISIEVGGVTYTTGGAGQTALDALEDLAAQIITAEGGGMTSVIITNAPGNYTLQIIDPTAVAAETWGDDAAGSDVLDNEQILGGDGGNANTATINYVAGNAANPDAVATLVQAGTDQDVSIVVVNGQPVEGTDPNTGAFSDTFVITPEAANIAVTADLAIGDGAIVSDADALAAMNKIMDWDVGGAQDVLNFAVLNEAGTITNYDEDDGATSLLDAVAAINAMLEAGGPVHYAAVEVFLSGPLTSDMAASTAGTDPLTIPGGYHTVVGADTNADGTADALVILVGVGSAAAGVDGFTQTDLVAIPV